VGILISLLNDRILLKNFSPSTFPSCSLSFSFLFSFFFSLSNADCLCIMLFTTFLSSLSLPLRLLCYTQRGRDMWRSYAFSSRDALTSPSPLSAFLFSHSSLCLQRSICFHSPALSSCNLSLSLPLIPTASKPFFLCAFFLFLTPQSFELVCIHHFSKLHLKHFMDVCLFLLKGYVHTLDFFDFISICLFSSVSLFSLIHWMSLDTSS
jgi:hypothetical protein